MNVNEIEPAPPAPAFRGCLFALLFMAFVIGAVQVTLVAGCASAPELPGLPDGAIEFVTNYLDRISQEKPGAGADSAAEPTEGNATAPAPGDVDEDTTAQTPETQPPPAPAISWKYGGVDGSRAKEDPATQIKDLKISGDGLRYAWAKGDLSNWGLSKTDAGALACAFWWDGKQWVGGKFDWISTSRLTRDFKNIRDHYNGWNPDAFFGAKRRAFCIMSADGRKRTNLIEEAK